MNIKMKQSYRNAVRQAIKNGIKRLFMECSTPNWDKEGSEAIETETIINCMNFIDILPDKMLFTPPSLGAMPDGRIGFEWYGDEDNLVNIIIGDKENWMHYARIISNKRGVGRCDFTVHCPGELF